VLYAPLGFFLQNPVGDLLVAFTKDQVRTSCPPASCPKLQPAHTPALSSGRPGTHLHAAALRHQRPATHHCRRRALAEPPPGPPKKVPPIPPLQDMHDENLVDTLHYLGIYGLIMLSTVITGAAPCSARMPRPHAMHARATARQCNVSHAVHHHQGCGPSAPSTSLRQHITACTAICVAAVRCSAVQALGRRRCRPSNPTPPPPNCSLHPDRIFLDLCRRSDHRHLPDADLLPSGRY